ncbi:MAG: pknD, partial [bacterium]
MDSGRPLDPSEILADALALPADQRAAFLDRACGGDLPLRAEIESLLAVNGPAKAFFERPLVMSLSGMATDAGSPGGASAPPDGWSGRTIGAWRLLERIATGGMGTVYRGERTDREFEKKVAVKLIRSGLDSEEVLVRFRLERQLLADLEHPNIGRLLDGGSTPEGLPYLVMEFVDGHPLDRYCDDQKLGVAARLQLFLTVCGAVEHAHQHLVIHRDLKPANIMVDRAGNVKLLDFGIAKVIGSDEAGNDLTVTTARRLTPRYASPEQVAGDRLSTATDIYSLGVILYELLAGRSPYPSARTPFEAEQAVQTATLVRPSQALQSDIPRTGEAATGSATGRGPGHHRHAGTRARSAPAIPDGAGPGRRHPPTPDRAASAGATGHPPLSPVAFHAAEPRPDGGRRGQLRHADRRAGPDHVRVPRVGSKSPEGGVAGLPELAGGRRVVHPLEPGRRGGAATGRGWHHLDGRLDRSRRNWRAHAAGITRLSYLDGGRRILTASVDKTVRLWSADGDSLATLGPFDSEVESAALVKSTGEIVIGLGDGTVLLVNEANTGPPTRLGQGGSWARVDVSPDGSTIAAGYFDGQVQLWDAPTRRLEAEWKAGEKLLIPAFAPTGRTLATVSSDGRIRFWSPDGRTERTEIAAHSRRIYSVAWSHDGERLASGSMDQTVMVWKAHGDAPPGIFREHHGTITGLDFLDDGSSVLSAGADGRLLTWNPDNGGVEAELRGHTSDVSAVAVSPDGRTLASGDWAGFVRLWDRHVDDVTTLVPHQNRFLVPRIIDIRFDDAGTRLVGLTNNDDCLEWNIATRGLRKRLLKGARQAAFDSPTTILVTTS